MATSALESFDDEDMPKPPLVRHPAFPAIVATWFATLLGLGMLVLPSVVIERLVGATGLAAIVPAAAPPLGATARASIAIVAALAGAAAGWAIARRVAGTQDFAEEPRRARYPSAIRRPINVRDELGDDVMFEDFGLPVPGQDLPVPEDREPPELHSEPSLPESVADEALESPHAQLDTPGEVEPAAADSAASASVDQGEPLAFTAPSLRRAEQSGESAAPTCDRPQEPAQLDGLGLVDLAARLRTSIERRREWIASATASAPRVAPADFEAAPAEEAAQAMAAYFGRPTPIGGDAHPVSLPNPQDGESGSDGAASPCSPAAAQAAGADRAETDATLRAALANLQRVSGRA